MSRSDHCGQNHPKDLIFSHCDRYCSQRLFSNDHPHNTGVCFRQFSRPALSAYCKSIGSPFGGPKEDLRFSWAWEDADENEIQTAYRLVVSNRLNQFEEGSYLYDSGWVETALSSGVTPAGLSPLLEDNQIYYWAVQVRDGDGLESELSAPHQFVTSVGADWKSQNGIWGSSDEKFVFFRSEISFEKPVEAAVASVTGSSSKSTQQFVYQFYVNGECVGLGPSVQNHSTLYYNTYDITSLLQQGSNVLGAVCYSEKQQGFLCQITLFYSDGTKEILLNSGAQPDQWKILNADSVFGYQDKSIASYYQASPENLNGTLYPYGWNQVGFSSSGWSLPPASAKWNKSIKEF